MVEPLREIIYEIEGKPVVRTLILSRPGPDGCFNGNFYPYVGINPISVIRLHTSKAVDVYPFVEAFKGTEDFNQRSGFGTIGDYSIYGVCIKSPKIDSNGSNSCIPLYSLHSSNGEPFDPISAYRLFITFASQPPVSVMTARDNVPFIASFSRAIPPNLEDVVKTLQHIKYPFTLLSLERHIQDESYHPSDIVRQALEAEKSTLYYRISVLTNKIAGFFQRKLAQPAS